MTLSLVGGDTVNISGGTALSVETGYQSGEDIDAFDANEINITGGKNHTITGKLMNVTIGQKDASSQPTEVFVKLEKNSRDHVTVYGGTEHTIRNSGAVNVYGGKVITIDSAEKADGMVCGLFCSWIRRLPGSRPIRIFLPTII